MSDLSKRRFEKCQMELNNEGQIYIPRMLPNLNTYM
jgi:hypothetical protein